MAVIVIQKSLPLKRAKQKLLRFAGGRQMGMSLFANQPECRADFPGESFTVVSTNLDAAALGRTILGEGADD